MENQIMLTTVLVTLITGTASLCIAEKFNFPAIILYLISGLSFGPFFFNIIRPASLGSGLNLMITLFVSIILFEGGFSLNFKGLVQMRKTVVRQLLFGTALTMTVSFCAAIFILGLSIKAALVFASLTIVTGPTVVKPILQKVPVSSKLKILLNAESVLIDVIGALLSIITLEFAIFNLPPIRFVLTFGLSLLIGGSIGTTAGLLLRSVFSRTEWIPEKSQSILVLSFVFLIYFLSNLLFQESGLTAVLAFGIVLSTLEYRKKNTILEFKDQITRIVISILFILLAAGFDLRLVSSHLKESFLIVLAIILVRFPVVFLSTWKSGLSLREKLFAGWFGPRGIIALSMASIAAVKLSSAGIGDGRYVESLIFMVIICTVVLQGLSAPFLAGLLKITSIGDKNLMILGINDLTLALASAWTAGKREVLMIDSDPKNIERAADKGFRYLEGNCLDSRLYENIDMEQYTSVLSASENTETNLLFLRWIKDSYGISNLYTILDAEANQRLSSIIKNDQIRIAFGWVNTRKKTSGKQIFKKILSMIKNINKNQPSPDQPKPRLFSVLHPDSLVQEMEQTEGLLGLFIVRGENYIIHHQGLAPRTHDKMMILLSDQDIPKAEKICGPLVG